MNSGPHHSHTDHVVSLFYKYIFNHVVSRCRTAVASLLTTSATAIIHGNSPFDFYNQQSSTSYPHSLVSFVHIQNWPPTQRQACYSPLVLYSAMATYGQSMFLRFRYEMGSSNDTPSFKIYPRLESNPPNKSTSFNNKMSGRTSRGRSRHLFLTSEDQTNSFFNFLTSTTRLYRT